MGTTRKVKLKAGDVLDEQALETVPKDTVIAAEVAGETRLWRKIWNGTGYSWDMQHRMEMYTQAEIASLQPRLRMLLG